MLSIVALLLTFASSTVTMVSEMFGPSTRPNVIHMPVTELVVMWGALVPLVHLPDVRVILTRLFQR